MSLLTTFMNTWPNILLCIHWIRKKFYSVGPRPQIQLHDVGQRVEPHPQPGSNLYLSGCSVIKGHKQTLAFGVRILGRGWWRSQWPLALRDRINISNWKFRLKIFLGKFLPWMIPIGSTIPRHAHIICMRSRVKTLSSGIETLKWYCQQMWKQFW